ncbi:MAG TPA: 2,3-bisphosphoglycerate-independent phosphoglycerate mutase [Bacteroidales bacterium]|nr:2,3-bisphosphoglycerate-independent phosphoglycerate mutase [Bacteroidales bacterium]HOR11219.1 2,3-bisphosphoglycerate-independent phosphoglycerate mutase [Bacteroidales bacterium]HOZ18907.1 2,3-bisphosphoglycerate-independent phosphoglycerate mutase [Bacteroidales bacterium]HPB77660.1 2,3-bisphosphoglycerate-independent phosphoglycerate mutase [Bacteroidales bacterium]HPK38281.1 2,3-bisphosphoglycerate-independent phosphoglycerate mutase [Bacteroidales bacterium]
MKKVLLMILDGWGEGKKDRTNAIYTAGQPLIEKIRNAYVHSTLSTSGEDVGLPGGQMGNSEVGHLNIGAGRIVYQDLVKINRACRDGSIQDNKEVKAVYQYVKHSGKALHLMGLVSEGGVHSSMEHLFTFIDIAHQYGLSKVYVHCLMDGRDTDPMSGKGYVQNLEEHLAARTGKIASVIGRYYTMDRDKRWDRIKIGYDLAVHGIGSPFRKAVDGIAASYDAGVTDEFIKPIVCVDESGIPIGTLAKDDAMILFNFRNDRARQITRVLTQENMPEYEMYTIPLYYCCLTPYDDAFKGLHILFDKNNVRDTIGEIVSRNGLRQLRIAETEKYAHVTFFFSGGREEVFPLEDRILVPSPKVATYDLQPEMSAPQVAEKITQALNTKAYSFIVLNFANGDMVGHTGVYQAICQAVKTIDSLAYQVTQTAIQNGYSVIITADHGNADNALNPDGSPNTAHSMNPVPFIVVDDQVKAVENGILADIAPTILDLMGIPAPVEMTGKSLIHK